MSDPFERAKGGRLTFKGGSLATRSKSIDKNKNKKKKKKKDNELNGGEYDAENQEASTAVELEGTGADGAGDIYTIDAAKKMKYEELFPVETKKFGYDPKLKAKSVADALDDRVKKKADRYCK